MMPISDPRDRSFYPHHTHMKNTFLHYPGVSIGIGIGGGSVDKTLKFYVKVSYVIGKALSGELFCTRTGLVVLPVTS